MERKELPSFFAIVGAHDDYEGKEEEVYGKGDADAVMDAMEKKIKTSIDMLDDYCKHIEELEREKSALIKTQEFHIERIKELEATISKMETTGWVSVKDRMPKKKQIVLVSFGYRSLGLYFPMDVIRWCKDYETDKSNVTHWMPLPPPPKEEGK